MEKIPFNIEINRVIELLAAQIYPTPFALLRENVQNSFDAILQRIHKSDQFDPLIEITIHTNQIIVKDNGIGMSRIDLKEHYWRAGSSSKNNAEARAAGVVGTFGIGAMANFGIAEELTVLTESLSGEKTECKASKSTLSVTDDCITVMELNSTGVPGTTVTASIQKGKEISVREAETYISQFVSYVPIKVIVNGKISSQNSIDDSVPKIVETWSTREDNIDLGNGIKANVWLSVAFNGDTRIDLSNIHIDSTLLQGRLILRQGVSSLRTFRSGFGLATAGVASVYQFGGTADFLFLKPTAGREALNTDSLALLQKIVSCLDRFVSLQLSTRPESNSNQYFVNWVYQNKRFELCSFLRVRVEPKQTILLNQIKETYGDKTILVYQGNDPNTIGLATEEKSIFVISQNSPRRECEIMYMKKFFAIEILSDNPKVDKKKESELSIEETALSFKISSILSKDYFLDSSIGFGKISHGLPILIPKQSIPVEIFLDPSVSSIKVILQLYNSEYIAFDHMVKDFVRNSIFPKIKDLVPSATRQGAESFLKMINKSREIFEYDTDDVQSLASLWSEYLNGKVTYQQASFNAQRLVKSHQIIDVTNSSPLKEVVNDVLQNEQITHQEISFDAAPAIQRPDVFTPSKILTIAQDEEPLKGCRCFLALTDKVKEERGDFFLQPHKTSIVWGGQKALFIFQHHSGEYGLYYDLQTQSLINQQSGGGTFETATIIMKNRIFIPIPAQIQDCFIPLVNEKKKFEVKCDILFIDAD